MKRRFAIPATDGMLDPHFGHCRSFAIIDTEDGHMGQAEYIDAPPHQPGMLPGWIAARGVTDVIAGGMGQRAIQLFNQHSINVFVGAPVLTPAELVDGLLKERISFSENYCDH